MEYLEKDVELIWNRGVSYTEDDLVFDVILINENAEEIEVAMRLRGYFFCFRKLKL